MTMRWTPYGKHGVLVHFADKPGEWAFHKCQAIVRELERKPPTDLLEFVPGYTSVLLEFRESVPLKQTMKELMSRFQAATRAKIKPGPIKELPIRYDGPDLERVAAHHSITREKVIEYHSAPTYKVYLLGFSPGFPYLGDLHHKLHTPRLSAPRPRVPSGSVAIGGQHTGIYSVESPGGWNIIGHTDTVLFNPSFSLGSDEELAFFLRQGDQVRFVPL